MHAPPQPESGPLSGTRVIELASIGPAPLAAMMLADLGADVVRIERHTGGRHGDPRAHTAGHDINYLSLTGALHAIGSPDAPPPPPLNFIADVAGGSMLLISGVLAALVDRGRSGEGQVVDAAVVDGVAVGLQMLWALRAQGLWSDHRGANVLDGAAPFYRTYTCADERFMAVGAIEPEFYELFIGGLGLDAESLPSRENPLNWPALTEVFTSRFATKTRDEWAAIFDGTDACVTPVLTFVEATEEAHLVERGSIISLGGVPQGAPAPRFSRHSQPVPTDPPGIDENRAEILSDWLGI